MRVPVLICGAGPTGLGAAWRLAAHGSRDWLIVESDDAPGGLARSIVDAQGFTWDLGGHVQFSHYEMFDDLMDALLGPDGWLYHERESWVWVSGRFVPYPFQLNLHRLPERERLACVEGLEAAAGSGQPARLETFADWIQATFGAGIADLFMRPYNRKVWARDPERMDWRWVGDRVATVDLARVRENIQLGRDDVSWGPNNRFRFPRRGGTGAVWRALSDRLLAVHPYGIRFGASIASIEIAAHRATLADGTTIEYDRLLSTMPLDVLVAMSDLPAAAKSATDDLEYSSTHIIGVALDGTAPPHLQGKCWMYFPEADCPFYRVTHFSHYSPNNVPDSERQWSLMAEVSESPYKAVDADRVAGETVRGLVATGLVDTVERVNHTWHRRIERGYPIPSRYRDRALAQLMPVLEAQDVFSRGRFGAWKYEVSNQDHSFAQGVEVVDRWSGNGAEHTLNTPDLVNSRRPAPRTEGRV